MALTDVPLAGQTLAATQNPIRQNFIDTNAGFLVDHKALNSTGAGKHNKVTMPLVNTSPGPAVFLANELGLYNLVSNGKNQVFVHKQNFAGTVDIPFTASILDQKAVATLGTTGWTYLPSGIIMKWGATTIPSAAININAGGDFGPNMTKLLNITSNAINSNVAFSVSATIALPIINLHFSATATVQIYWCVIGV